MNRVGVAQTVPYSIVSFTSVHVAAGEQVGFVQPSVTVVVVAVVDVRPVGAFGELPV